jgi:hypothetical protein
MLRELILGKWIIIVVLLVSLDPVLGQTANVNADNNPGVNADNNVGPDVNAGATTQAPPRLKIDSTLNQDPDVSQHMNHDRGYHSDDDLAHHLIHSRRVRPKEDDKDDRHRNDIKH